MSKIAVRRAIYGKLAGDSTLTSMLATPPAGRAQNIWHQEAGQKADFPLVIFNRQSPATPLETLGDPNAIMDELWQVKGIIKAGDVASSDAVDGIADRIVALLNDAKLTIAGQTCLYLRREQDVEYPETVGDTRWLHSGAVFRLKYQ